jgi:hypothetical protein
MRSIFIVGAKLMGIFYLISVAATLPPLISMLVSTVTDGNWGELMPTSGMLAFSAVHYTLLLGLTLYLILRTERIANLLRIPADTAAPQLSRRNTTAAGLQLIGFYILITKLPMLLALVITNNGTLPSFPSTVGGFDPLVATVTSILSIGMILGANKLARALAGNTEAIPESRPAT